MAKYINLLRSELAEEIEIFVSKNKLQPHDKLPSEREFTAMWNVNRTTLRCAIQSLIDEGFLYNIPGSGTYVAPKKVERDLYHFNSFTENMAQKDFEVKSKIVSIKKTEADEHMAKVLSIPPGQEILQIKRVRIVNGEPLAVEESYIEYDLCRGIEKHDLENQSLYNILKDVYGIKLAAQKPKISIEHLREEESNHLGIEKGTAVLVLRGVTLDDKEKPVEYSISITRGDRCVFRTILK